MDDILLGTLTGVLSTFVFLVLGYATRNLLGTLIALLPGVNPRQIRGTWYTCFDMNGEIRTEEVEVRQFLASVWGTVTYAADGKKRTYSLRGFLRQNYFTSTYKVKSDRKANDIGSFTLKITNLATYMDGMYSWPNDAGGDPVCGKYYWFKVGSERDNKVAELRGEA